MLPSAVNSRHALHGVESNHHGRVSEQERPGGRGCSMPLCAAGGPDGVGGHGGGECAAGGGGGGGGVVSEGYRAAFWICAASMVLVIG